MITENEFVKIKLGTILENDKDQRYATVFKTNSSLGLYDYLNGKFSIFTVECIKKEYNIVKDKNVLNLMANINKNIAAITIFINEAIRLFNNNPHIYNRAFTNYEMMDKDFAYLHDKDLVMEKIVKDKRNGKSYTIIDIMNISDELHFILERIGSVLGTFMEYEKLCIKKSEFTDNYEFVSDILNSDNDEPVYLYTDDEVKKLFEEPLKPNDKKPKTKFECFRKNVNNIYSVDGLNKMIEYPDNQYIDLFVGGLNIGENYLIISPNYDQFIKIIGINNNFIEYELYKVDDDDIVNFINKGDILDVELYTILWVEGSNEFNIKNNIKDPKNTLLSANNYLEISNDLKCKTIDGRICDCKIINKGVFVPNNNGCEYSEIDAVNLRNVRGTELYHRFFVPYRYKIINYKSYRSFDTEYDHMDYKLGDVLVYDNKLSMVVSKVNKKSYCFYLNFINRKDVITIKISKDFLMKNKYDFKYYQALSIQALAKL